MRAWLALGLMLPLAAWTQTRDFEGDSRNAGRGDGVPVQLPEYPAPENYLPLQVSATTAFEFFVDEKSVSVGRDGVVRYTLIAKSPDGALNVSFEGMRCSDGKYRIYAFGRSDKTWSEARSALWQAMPADTRNAQRAVLYSEYLCSKSGMIGKAEDVVRALRYGPPSRSGF
jgi:hypothetical protein